jgi:hypothetical protein
MIAVTARGSSFFLSSSSFYRCWLVGWSVLKNLEISELKIKNAHYLIIAFAFASQLLS